MKRKILVINIFFCIILSGCNKVPDEVKNFGSVTDFISLSQIKEHNNQSLKLTIGDKLCIDSTICVPNKDTINSYEVKPKKFDKDSLFDALSLNENEFKIVQGAFYDLDDENYEPVALCSDKETLYIDSKNGQIFFGSINGSQSDIFIEKNQIPMESAKCEANLEQAHQMISSTLKKLDIEYTISDTKVYRDGETDYYYFQLAQVIDQLRIDNEENAFASDTTSMGRHFMDVVISSEERIVWLEAKLCEIKQSSDSYSELLSADAAIEIIENKIDLLLHEDSDYVKKDGKVNISKIELIFVPQYINSDTLHYRLIPVWLFHSGLNINTNIYCNIRINAITGEIL